jgi:hypothetical protein
MLWFVWIAWLAKTALALETGVDVLVLEPGDRSRSSALNLTFLGKTYVMYVETSDALVGSHSSQGQDVLNEWEVALIVTLGAIVFAGIIALAIGAVRCARPRPYNPGRPVPGGLVLPHRRCRY